MGRSPCGGVSPHTVVSHIKNLYRKLGTHTAAAAVLRAIQLGLLDPSSEAVP